MKWIYNPEIVEDYIEAEGTRILGNERLGYLPQELQDKDKEKVYMNSFQKWTVFGIRRQRIWENMQTNLECL